MDKAKRSAKPSGEAGAETAPTPDELLGFFFPIHYQIGVELEDVLRRGVLSRRQAAILWLIRSEGGARQSVSRKRVEALLTSFYEVTSSAITKSIRAMSHAPLELVRIEEDPASGRERRVALTRKGQKFVEAMAEDGRRFAAEVVRGLDRAEIRAGAHFLDRVIGEVRKVRSRRLERKAADRDRKRVSR